MHHFSVFGGVLRSALPFPELSAVAPSPADWTLRVGEPAPPPADAPILGMQRYAGDVDVRLRRAGAGLRVETSDIGDFDVSPDGAIVWRPRDGASEEWARFDVLGRVLPVALHVRGLLVLHGSSVVLPCGRAIAVLGPKGRGKSTLALALAQRGGRLLSDDVTVLEPGAERCLARPGVHAVRLWDDSARALGVERYGPTGSIGRKLVVHGVPEVLRAHDAAPLDAVYLLSGEGVPSDHPPAVRHRLPPRAAALALVRQATAGGLLGGDEGARLLQRASVVARLVPVYTLRMTRDYERLDALAALVAAWSAAADEPGSKSRMPAGASA